MEKLDLKDRKILYELDCNSRQSFRAIGKKVGLSKDVVSSRVKILQKKGIIIKFFTYVDHLKLGLTMCRFYFKYQYATPKVKKEIIEHFSNYEHILNVYSTEGSYDFGVIILVKNVKDIYPFWQKTLDKYGIYFSKKIFSVYMGESIYGKTFFLNENEPMQKIPHTRGLNQEKIDDLDFKILKTLSLDSRTPTIEIAKKLKSTVTTISSRIKKLVELKIILGFTVDIDFNKIGFQFWKVDFFLSDHNQRYQIIKYIEKNPRLYSVDHTIGYADLELEIFVRNINQLHEIIENISIKFPKIIRDYSYFRVFEMHKWYGFKFYK